jgi:four helix bundle protein
MAESILQIRSYAFAERIIRLYQFLQKEKKEYVLAKQLLKSGTSVGAMIREAAFAQSKPDFINKMSIGLKEANETAYWLNLLHDTGYIEIKLFNSFYSNCQEIIKMLVATIKTAIGLD